jgi:hypothetical protein
MEDYKSYPLASVEPRPDYTLLATFETGETKIYDCKPDLEKEVFAPLKNLALFMQARNDHDAVVWNDAIDMAAEHLYYYGLPVGDTRL